VDGDTAALSEGLQDGLDLHGHLNCKTGDGIDLGTVVSGVGVDGSIHINGVAPSSIDLLDGSTDVHEEGTVTVVGALASIGEVPLEVDLSNAESVLENPGEGTIGIVLEALKIRPLDTLRDTTGPVILVVDDGLTSLHDLPNLLADLDKLVDVDLAIVQLVLVLAKEVARILNGAVDGAGEGDRSDADLVIGEGCQCDTGNSEQCNNGAHYRTCVVVVRKEKREKRPSNYFTTICKKEKPSF